MSQILCFGDSTVWGAWDSEGGWVARLRKEIDKRNIKEKNFYWAVHNLGISGGTSKSLLKRIIPETEARLEEGETIIIIRTGANDSAWIQSKKSNQVPLKEFEKNMKKIISEVKKITNKIIIIGLEKNDESKTQPVSWDNDFYYKNQIFIEYDQKLKEISKEEKIGFIETIDDSEDYLANLDEDGVHPNNKGHERIYKKVYDYLKNNNLLNINI